MSQNSKNTLIIIILVIIQCELTQIIPPDQATCECVCVSVCP